jgi:predicted ester cyclase
VPLLNQTIDTRLKGADVIQKLDPRWDHLKTNKDIMRFFVQEVQAGGNLDLIEEFVKSDYVNHTPSPGQENGPEGVRFICEKLHEAFDDFQIDIGHQVDDGDCVATYKLFKGTHVGEWLGLAPTGKRIEFWVFDLIRFRDRMFTEHWAVIDEANMMRQLGMIE